MERATGDQQIIRLETVLEELTSLQSAIKNGRNAPFAELTKAESELEDFGRAAALQTLLAPVTLSPGGFHVGETG